MYIQMGYNGQMVYIGNTCYHITYMHVERVYILGHACRATLACSGSLKSKDSHTSTSRKHGKK